MSLPEPVIRPHDAGGREVLVLRDDMIEGGTKVRVIPPLLGGAEEWVYAGPAQGYAQLALAIACADAGKVATVFVPHRHQPTAVTRRALERGGRIVQVPAGRLSVLQARAREYCASTGALMVPLGLRFPGMHAAIVALCRSLPLSPEEVWVTAGSGQLAAAMADAWPAAAINAVQVGKVPDLPERVRLWRAPESFTDDARGPRPPFPSARNYDAKAWRFVCEEARPGALFWNVAGEPEPVNSGPTA